MEGQARPPRVYASASCFRGRDALVKRRATERARTQDGRDGGRRQSHGNRKTLSDAAFDATRHAALWLTVIWGLLRTERGSERGRGRREGRKERAGESESERAREQERAPSPTLSPTDPVPRGLLTLCSAAY